jgi:hypothetical protein
VPPEREVIDEPSRQPRHLPTGALPARLYHQRDATQSPCKLQLDAGVLGQPDRQEQ